MAEIINKLPPWLSKRLSEPGKHSAVNAALGRLRLRTVCREAHCPNICECFARGTATFMILGHNCTRSCSFCAVATGVPEPPEPDEPQRVAMAAAELKLRHVVITSVTRDDLRDGGSRQFQRTIGAVKKATEATVEVLTPDFGGRNADIDRVIDARPDIYNHNLETVRRLYPEVRPQADYRRSLALIRRVADAGGIAKSGLMLGLGETEAELLSVMKDLLDAGCSALTMGQYLPPSGAHFGVKEYVHPKQFKRMGGEARNLGFRAVASAPFVRSSYNAGLMAGEIAGEKQH